MSEELPLFPQLDLDLLELRKIIGDDGGEEEIRKQGVLFLSAVIIPLLEIHFLFTQASERTTFLHPLDERKTSKSFQGWRRALHYHRCSVLLCKDPTFSASE